MRFANTARKLRDRSSLNRTDFFESSQHTIEILKETLALRAYLEFARLMNRSR
jgi:ADP-dependent phosphofructokinase/glucokinase